MSDDRSSRPPLQATIVRTTWPVEVHTPRLVLRGARPDEAPAVMAYFERNAAHLAPWLPPPPRGMAEGGLAFWEQMVEEMATLYEDRQSVRFFVRPRSAPDQLIGLRSFTRIHMGQDRACTMSGSIDHAHLRRGYMTEAGHGGIQFMFRVLGIRRIDAEYSIDNPGSPGVLAKLGFTRIGVSPSHRFANGAWRDHVLNALVDPDHQATDVHFVG